MNSANIETIVRVIHKDLSPKFEEELRGHLKQKSKKWLVDQIVRLTMDKHSLQAWDRKEVQKKKDRQRNERITRLKEMQLDEPKLDAFIKKYDHYRRDDLEKEGFLLKNPPEKGTSLVAPKFRSEAGEKLLTEAKDILFAILYGDESTFVTLDRVEQELLTLTLPRFKAQALDFMKATTEIDSMGNWQDPDGVSNDERADNIIIQVEYGEVASERVGDGVLTTLRLINNLEVNEQILYARMINVEQSSLIS